jgi:hypothetical protein
MVVASEQGICVGREGANEDSNRDDELRSVGTELSGVRRGQAIRSAIGVRQGRSPDRVAPNDLHRLDDQTGAHWRAIWLCT